MPSIRVRNSPYISVRDIFDDQGSPAFQDPSPLLQHATPLARNRPTSVPVQDRSTGNDVQLTSPVSLRTPEESWRRRRPRSNSRIQAHVLSTYSSSRPNWSTEVQTSSSEALNPTASPGTEESQTPAIRVHHPDLVIVEGSQTNVAITAGLHSPGILERTFPTEVRHSRSFASRHDEDDEHHHDDIVEHLDVIDPQVGVVSSLTNAANSILLPPMGFSRKPVIVLSGPSRQDRESEQYEDALDRHVDDVLQRPSRVRRTLMGVWSFLKTPMGILTGIYGFLVVFWGAAIVFFLARFINFHNANTQGFWVEVSSQVVCGLFTITSVGFIPSRVLSTFRIWKIWRYKRKTITRRKTANIPQLFDVDDLPDPVYDPNFVRVLSEEEHKDLHRQQVKFTYHQTWYRAHGTETHRAFPITVALWICLLNDLNSIFQIILCGTMWGMNRFQRPAWSTGILIPAGFLCGIGAGVLIWRGGERTKRVEEVRERLRAALAATGEVQVVQSPEILPPTSISRKQPVPVVTESNMGEIQPQESHQGTTKSGRVKFAEAKLKPLPPPPQSPTESPELAVDELMTIPSTSTRTK